MLNLIKSTAMLSLLVAFGTVAVAAPVQAEEYAEVIGVVENETGLQGRDHVREWANTVSAAENVIGDQVADLGNYGFFEEAR